MIIETKDIEDSKINRDKFNKYYNDAVIDVLVLKKECKMSIKEIQKNTPYDIDFITHVIEDYDIDEIINNGETKYGISVRIYEYNINIEKLKEAGYNDALISEVLNPEEKGAAYYFSK